MQNKNLLNIAGIIALVLGILSCLTIFGAIVGVPVIIGGNKLRKYSEMNDQQLMVEKDNILIWAIVLCLLCTISGVLALIFYFGIDNVNVNNNSNNTNGGIDKYAELERLNNLYLQKAINKEEFEREKARILGN